MWLLPSHLAGLSVEHKWWMGFSLYFMDGVFTPPPVEVAAGQQLLKPPIYMWC